jgi:hypothetical protein
MEDSMDTPSGYYNQYGFNSDEWILLRPSDNLPKTWLPAKTEVGFLPYSAVEQNQRD